MVAENRKLSQHPAAEPAAPLGSGVYVDVENLQTAAQEVVRALMESWPDSFPTPSLLSLYVRADQSDLWRMWAESHFPGIPVKAKGIQHFSNTPAKNSADIAIAVDAMADFLMRRIDCVAVVSDDSDFISLYSKLRDEQAAIGHQPGKVPFLWVVTDRPRTRSLFMQEFFPNDHVHTVPFPKKANISTVKTAPSQEATSQEATARKAEENSILEDMARAIIKEIPVGNFKSTACQRIIQSQWENHPLGTTNGSSYGVRFSNEVWPILEKFGVKKHHNNGRALKYEMTQDAKEAVRDSL